MELILLWIIGIYVVSYRKNNGENVYRFFITQVQDTYEKFAPYSYKEVREKVKNLQFASIRVRLSCLLELLGEFLTCIFTIL